MVRGIVPAFETYQTRIVFGNVMIVYAVEQIVGPERRERVLHHDWSGDT
jgi:hypothetical protein